MSQILWILKIITACALNFVIGKSEGIVLLIHCTFKDYAQQNLQIYNSLLAS